MQRDGHHICVRNFCSIFHWHNWTMVYVHSAVGFCEFSVIGFQFACSVQSKFYSILVICWDNSHITRSFAFQHCWGRWLFLQHQIKLPLCLPTVYLLWFVRTKFSNWYNGAVSWLRIIYFQILQVLITKGELTFFRRISRSKWFRTVTFMSLSALLLDSLKCVKPDISW